MSLTLDQQRAVANHLRSRAQPPQCPVCGASNMTVLEEVTISPTRQEDDTRLPSANVMCKYCGFILQFSLSVVGTNDD